MTYLISLRFVSSSILSSFRNSSPPIICYNNLKITLYLVPVNVYLIFTSLLILFSHEIVKFVKIKNYFFSDGWSCYNNILD